MVGRVFLLALLSVGALGFRKPSQRDASREEAALTSQEEAALTATLNNPDELTTAVRDLAQSLHHGNYVDIEAKLGNIGNLTGQPLVMEDSHLNPFVLCEIGCGACIGATYLTCVAPPYGECAFAVIGCVAACSQCTETLCMLMPVAWLCNKGFPIPDDVCQTCGA